MSDTLEDIRNIGIMAHIDAGKTTTTERILYYSGKTHRVGEVHDGNAVMDWMPQEQERGITITSAATTLYWKSKRINLIDTPGHVDFTVEVERSIRVLDGAIVLLCGVAGVEPQTETVWRQAVKNKVPRLIYINKLDRTGADFESAFKSLNKTLTTKAVALQYPVGREGGFNGIIDLLEWNVSFYQDEIDALVETREIPEEYLEKATEYRDKLVEYLADYNEEILTKFLEGERIESALLKKVIRELTVKGDVFPVLCGSCFKNKGVKRLLDAVVEYLPSPSDIKDVKAVTKTTNEEISIKISADAPLRALAFKITYDSFIGKMVYVRVYSGVIEKGNKIFISNTGKKERVGRILLMHANHQEDRDSVTSGEIAVLVGLKNIKTGDTISSEHNAVLLEVIHFPEPVISMAIEAKSTGDSKKLENVLARLEEEDPTLKVGLNPETGQKILSGMGELHLEIIKDRILREDKLAVRVGVPQVAYRETISKVTKISVTVDKIIGGDRIYAEMDFKLEPLKRASGNIIEIGTLKGKISDGLITALNNTLTSVTTTGISGIYPVVDVKLEVLDVKYADDEHSETALNMAVMIAFEKALKLADPQLLEPVMKLEIATPEEFNGDIIGDLNSRRGKIVNLTSKGDNRLIMAEMPLASMVGYATVLRSLSKGRASYGMEPFTFEVVPKKIKEKILGWNQF